MNEEERKVFGGSNVARRIFSLSWLILCVGLLLFLLGKWPFGILFCIIYIVLVIVSHRLSGGKSNTMLYGDDLWSLIVSSYNHGLAKIGFHRFRDQQELLDILAELQLSGMKPGNLRNYLRKQLISRKFVFDALTDYIVIKSIRNEKEIFWDANGQQVSGKRFYSAEIIIDIDFSVILQFSSYLKGLGSEPDIQEGKIIIRDDTKEDSSETGNKFVTNGTASLERGNYREAIGYFDKALRVDSQNASALYGKVIAYDKLGNMTEAIKCYDEVIKTNPEDKAYWNDQAKIIFNNKGINLAEQGEYESALSCFESALHIDDKYVDALYNMGNCLILLQRFKEALSYCDKVLSIDTAYIQALLNKGVIYYRLEDYDKAIYFFDKVIEIDPQYYQAWHNKVFALKKLGKDREAAKCFRVVKKLRNHNNTL